MRYTVFYMKTIVVTGAHGGIGEAIVEALTVAGHTVIGVDRKDTDVSNFAQVQRLQEKVLSDVDHIDWLVCAHGYLDPMTILEEQSPESIEVTFLVNSVSLAYLAKAFLRHIPAGGGIIALSSTASLHASGATPVYSASKAAVNSFMQTLAHNRKEQVFYALCPGPTNTTLRERFAHDAAKQQSPDVVASVVLELVNGSGEHTSGDIIVVRDSVTTTFEKLS